jgi:hypothetical protein
VEQIPTERRQRIGPPNPATPEPYPWWRTQRNPFWNISEWSLLRGAQALFDRLAEIKFPTLITSSIMDPHPELAKLGLRQLGSESETDPHSSDEKQPSSALTLIVSSSADDTEVQPPTQASDDATPDVSA